MEQDKLPRLTKDQLKRFQKYLVESGAASSLTQARKVTESPERLNKYFMQLIEKYKKDGNVLQLKQLAYRFKLRDIFEPYGLYDDEKEANHTHDKGHVSPNCISDKVSDSQPLANCISDKVFELVDLPNQIYDKGLLADDKGLSNQIYDKVDSEGVEPSNQIYDKGRVRGKQKEPLKVPFLLRLDSGQHERLKGLGGNTNEHIRQAIGLYLDSVQNQTV